MLDVGCLTSNVERGRTPRVLRRRSAQSRARGSRAGGDRSAVRQAPEGRGVREPPRRGSFDCSAVRQPPERRALGEAPARRGVGHPGRGRAARVERGDGVRRVERGDGVCEAPEGRGGCQLPERRRRLQALPRRNRGKLWLARRRGLPPGPSRRRSGGRRQGCMVTDAENEGLRRRHFYRRVNRGSWG